MPTQNKLTPIVSITGISTVGILTVGVAYGITLIRKFNSTHELLLRSNQHSTNISSARYGEMKEKIEEQHQLEQKVRAKQLATLRLLRLKMLLRLRQALDL